MSKVLTFVSVFVLLMFSSFAHSASVDCSTPEGQNSAVQSYIANGGVVPACGPDCTKDFVLSKVCPCATVTGIMGLAKEFVESGQAVAPSCGGMQCALNYIASKVCDGRSVKPNCFTQSGKELLIKSYKGPVPACGPDCARGFILNQVCPAPTAPTATDSGKQSDSSTASSSNGNDVKPSCSTAAGKELLIKSYKGIVPACGPTCAHDFILSQVCPAPSSSTGTDSENQEKDSASPASATSASAQ